MTLPVEVGELVWELDLSLENATTDLDLVVLRDGVQVESERGSSFSESLRLSVFESQLRSGLYHLKVECPAKVVLAGGQPVETVPFEIRVERKDSPFPLLEKGPNELRMEARKRSYAVYQIDFQGGPLTLFCPTADLDFHLLAHPFSPDWKDQAYSRTGQTGFKKANLDIPHGDYLVVVEGNLEDREVADFVFWNQVEPDPPRLRELTLQSGFEGECQKVVQLLTDDDSFGSGCLMSPRGHVLTSYHVLEADRGGILQEGEFTVGWLASPSQLAQERFYARVVETDQEGDLALLQITTDLSGRPVDLAFPYFEHGSVPQLASPLTMIGFPAQGWYHKRPGLMVASCVVAGFESHPEGTAIKTDGPTTGGFSGGATLDSAGRLVGLVRGIVPPYTFVWSLDRVPIRWWRLLEEAPQPGASF